MLSISENLKVFILFCQLFSYLDCLVACLLRLDQCKKGSETGSKTDSRRGSNNNSGMGSDRDTLEKKRRRLVEDFEILFDQFKPFQESYDWLLKDLC